MGKLYLKSYCYSKHELPFVLANLSEGYDYIEKLCLYEYNYTHTGVKKNYEMEYLIHLIPEKLRSKLHYRKVDLSDKIEYAYNDGGLIHRINEPIQRSWLFNDSEIKLNDDDIIIDHDIDEIIYKYSYKDLIDELNKKNKPLSIRLNQFFFKQNYLWTDCKFSSPTIYKYSHTSPRTIKGVTIMNMRDLQDKTDNIYGCHMSWIMPVDYMIKKLHSYSHPEFRKYADKELLQKAIEDKKYIFDLKRPFNIETLPLNSKLIPSVLQIDDIFYFI